MIPKIIHYCWFSGDPFPEDIQRCIDSWHRFLPDYELKLWNRQSFDVESCTWVKQALENKRYAFAADYIRVYALYNYGGIYLDSDVEVVRSFNDLLHLPYFLGTERYAASRLIEAAVVGTEKHNAYFGHLLDYYNARTFVNADGTFNMLPMPRILKQVGYAQGYRFKDIPSVDAFIYDPHVLSILPAAYFSPKDNRTLRICSTENTYAIHHFAGSWMKPATGLKAKYNKIRIRHADAWWFKAIFWPYYYLADAARDAVYRIKYKKS